MKDQIWVCECGWQGTKDSYIEGTQHSSPPWCNLQPILYIPAEAVRALEEKVREAVECLEGIMAARKIDMKEDGWIYHQAKSALSKIKESK